MKAMTVGSDRRYCHVASTLIIRERKYVGQNEAWSMRRQQRDEHNAQLHRGRQAVLIRDTI